jgi:4-hydroxy-tetrahydrodipicolinate reductase
MEKPKIAIIGHGSMGKEVEALALAQGYQVTDIFEIDNKIDSNKIYNFDVAIDFSLPDAVYENVITLCKLKKNFVLGATGWHSEKDRIFELVKNAGVGMVYSSNFSVGMQIFNKVVKTAAQMLNKFDGYDIMLHEIHHKRKKDSPSGTAITLANIILEEYKKKTRILTETEHGQIEPTSLHVTSTRGGEIAGLHTVYIDSIADTIELTHRAKNRSGFALGALTAATWIHKKTGIYEFLDVIEKM